MRGLDPGPAPSPRTEFLGEILAYEREREIDRERERERARAHEDRQCSPTHAI